MHTNGCPQQNGDIANGSNLPSTSHLNGAHAPSANGDTIPSPRNNAIFSEMSQTDQDIIRLIGQHLQSLGLKLVLLFCVHLLKLYIFRLLLKRDTVFAQIQAALDLKPYSN
jgi:hypothetical protein